jgi:hypothetical protein
MKRSWPNGPTTYELTDQSAASTDDRVESCGRLAELFGANTAEQWQRLYANAFDWGPDVGFEVVDD